MGWGEMEKAGWTYVNCSKWRMHSVIKERVHRGQIRRDPDRGGSPHRSLAVTTGDASGQGGRRSLGEGRVEGCGGFPGTAPGRLSDQCLHHLTEVMHQGCLLLDILQSVKDPRESRERAWPPSLAPAPASVAGPLGSIIPAAHPHPIPQGLLR